jgi:hypothetical protein
MEDEIQLRTHSDLQLKCHQLSTDRTKPTTYVAVVRVLQDMSVEKCPEMEAEIAARLHNAAWSAKGVNFQQNACNRGRDTALN